MKTAELVRRLWAEDPSGDCECCVGNCDILFVAKEPAYYDGPLEVLARNPEEAPFYDVEGARLTGKGSKVQIHTYSISDMLFENPKFPVELDGIDNARWEPVIEDWRTEGLISEIEVAQAMRAHEEAKKQEVVPPLDDDYDYGRLDFFAENDGILGPLARAVRKIRDTIGAWRA